LSLCIHHITFCVGVQICATAWAVHPSLFVLESRSLPQTSVHHLLCWTPDLYCNFSAYHHLCWNCDCRNFRASPFCVTIQIWLTMEANLQCSRERSTYNMWTVNWQKGIHNHNLNFMKLLLQNSAILWNSLLILFCNIEI
jgi:hypothetical protein